MKQTFRNIVKNKYFKWFIGSILVLFVAFFSFYVSIYIGLWGPVPTTKQLSEIKQSEASEVFANDGELMGKYFLFDRQSITYNDLPKHLIDALVATEDARFFEHNGIDGQSLFRVFFKTILLQKTSAGGGSTITLQLAKNLYGRNDRSNVGIVVTKIRESIIARRMETLYTKDEILTLYFNTVPFSDNTFGIESAAMKFFNKHTAELSIAEAATLIGTLKASNYYNPRIHPERSIQRRNIVLSQMEKYKYLQPTVAETAKKDSLYLNYQYYSHNQGIATYFREHLRKEITQILDTLKKKNGGHYNLYQDGIKIYTTIDFEMQQYAETAMLQHMAALQKDFEKSYGNKAPWLMDKKLIQRELEKTALYKSLKKQKYSEKAILDSLNVPTNRQFFNYDETIDLQASVIDSIKHYLKFLNIGMLTVEPATGAVKTWIGGVDFSSFQFDHVSQSKRQVGSIFKPIVYAAALENGMEYCSYFPIQEVTYGEDYTPSNASTPDDNDPYLNYSLKYALSNSVNTIAVKVLMETGIGNVISQAQKMGITTELPEVPSLALGTAEISILEFVKAYTTFTNKGIPSTPYFITKIEDRNGNILAEFKPSQNKKAAYSEETRHYMLDMLKATVNEGTASRLRSAYGLRNDIAGKTGTTQNNKDGWFVGITPKLTTITWVGHDNYAIGFKNTSMGQGANSALPVFAAFYQLLNKDTRFDVYTKARFELVPNNIKEKLNCEPTKRDGFLKRLFSNPDKNKQGKKDKKGAFFSIFKKKDKN